jgi:hypothetical protein
VEMLSKETTAGSIAEAATTAQVRVFQMPATASRQPLLYLKDWTEGWKTEAGPEARTRSGLLAEKGLDEFDFKLVVGLGLLGLPLPGPVPFSRYLKILRNGRRWDFLQLQVDRHADPWKDIFKRIFESEYANAAWLPKPNAVLAKSKENEYPTACVWREKDALAAYIQALLWFFSSDRCHANAAMRILKTWAKVASGETGYRECIASDWTVLVLSGTGEILRRTNPDWAATELREFFTALKRACARA